MAAIRLLATDLDGTLIARAAEEFHLYGAFRDQVMDLRRRFNGVWVICTSRPMVSFRDFFSRMTALEVKPDYVVVEHAYIHRLTRWGFYLPHIRWNVRIAFVQWMNRRNIRQALNRWHRDIVFSVRGAKTLRRTGERLWMRFPSAELMAMAVSRLDGPVRQFRLMRMFCYRTEMDIRMVPFTKGLALKELADHLGITRADVLAIGNGHNDASMLDGSVAAMTGCPENSEPEVMTEVNQSGGHIARQPSMAGVIEVIQAHLNETVQSALPATWKNPAAMDPGEDLPRRKRHHDRRMDFRGILLMGAVIYIALLVFAVFDLLPFSSMIRKPYDLGLRVLGRVVKVCIR